MSCASTSDLVGAGGLRGQEFAFLPELTNTTHTAASRCTNAGVAKQELLDGQTLSPNTLLHAFRTCAGVAKRPHICDVVLDYGMLVGAGGSTGNQTIIT